MTSEDAQRPSPRLAARAIVLDATAGWPDLELGAADEWHVVLTDGAVPLAALRIPGPGDSPALAEAAIRRRARPALARAAAIARLERRLGLPDPPAVRRPSCAIVVCTRRRPGQIASLLEALASLDPSPDEVVVVDNDPGTLDCRSAATAAGATYVREDRPGLDRARNAGLAATSSELVAFTDDDCRPASHWLSRLPELFALPGVAAVTGPAFPAALDTAAQLRFERGATFSRGLRPRLLDWAALSPMHAGRAGAGANMVFRRAELVALGDPFPPELDAGTPTESGGDWYAFSRLLGAGRRIAYDPATWVLHEHRREWPRMRAAVASYGVGTSAALTKRLVEEREAEALVAWRWLPRQYMRALRRRARGEGDAADLAIAWDYLRGGLTGPWAWRRARAAAGSAPATGGTRLQVPGGVPEDRTARGPIRPRPLAASLAVAVICDPGDPPPERALRALAADPDAAGAEVLVVAPSRMPAIDEATNPRTRTLAAGSGWWASVRAAAGETRADRVLVLDARTAVRAGVVTAHAAGGADVLAGTVVPAPSDERLATLWEALRRLEVATGRERAAPTFIEVGATNVSLPRALALEAGGVEDVVGPARRGWALGLRLLAAGASLRLVDGARADQSLALDAAGLLARAGREGHDDAILRAHHPEAGVALAAAVTALPGDPEVGRGRPLRAPALDRLDRLRARRLWLRGMLPAWRAAYAAGSGGDAGLAPVAGAGGQEVSLDLHSPEPVLPPPVAAGTVELRAGGRVIGRVEPPSGRWTASLAETIADVAGPRHWGEPPAPVPAPAPRMAPSAITVLLAGGAASGLSRLEAAGAGAVAVPPGSAWAEFRRALAAPPSPVVALLLPGVDAGQPWLEGVRIALDGPRVALALGGTIRAGEPAPPVVLHDDEDPPPRALARGVLHVALRADALAAAGGLRDGEPRAALARLAERLVRGGRIVAAWDTPSP